jgi:hypothetical protein
VKERDKRDMKTKTCRESRAKSGGFGVAVVVGIMVALSLCGAAVFAVGPELPTSPKYSTFEIRGRVVSSFDENYSLQGACPLNYVQTIMKVYINDDVGTVAVIVPETLSIPELSTCVSASGMLLPPCYGDDVSIAVVRTITSDSTCE